MMRSVLAAALLVLLTVFPARGGYNLEVPVDPWDEYRLQFKNYSRFLAASYDRAFVDDYEGAIREVNKAIEILPDEGIGFAERSRYYRILSDARAAESDYKRALALFDKALERYRPGADKKTKVGRTARTANPAEATRLQATLRYQRGEAHYNFEQYRLASEDFAAACQGGHTVSCGRIWDIKAIEKRGSNWVPLLTRQFYDRQRIERPGRDLVRVWVRREEALPAQLPAGQDNYLQQHLELNCAAREFRLVEALLFSGKAETRSEKPLDAGFGKPVAGSAPSKLLALFCPRPALK